jgi:hypothetical protein
MWQLSEPCWRARLRSVGLASSIGLGAEVGGSRAGLGKVAGKDWLKEGAEDDLSATSLWKCHPEDEHKLEGVVKREPVNSVHGALEYSQERIDYPVRQPLGVIDFAGAEQGAQRVIAGNDETGNVDEEGAGNVEEDEEEVQACETKDGVDLGHRRLLFEVVEGGVFRQLLVELRQVRLGFLLHRHGGGGLLCGLWAVGRG